MEVMKKKLCPKCGKEMYEQGNWSGLWMCPDYRRAINDAPPFKYKCNGIIAEEIAGQSFEEACEEIIRSWN